MSDKLWGGRFRSAVDPRIDRFTSALAFDRRLVRHDLVGCLAHARMLLEQRILERADGEAILQGLSQLLAAVEEGSEEVSGADEDVHSWIERRLGERIGEPALRLHTARSRNDQTGVALRLYVREALQDLARGILELLTQWRGRAAGHVETWLPGYTHLQRGQPVSLAHHLLAHFWALEADARRVRRLSEGGLASPLGAAALAGSPYPVDPARSAELLGLAGVYPNSMLAVADRDYVAETAFLCALLMIHLSRWAAEIVLWTSAEFGFASLEDSVAKGSSLMPQKRNPEAAEILRGKGGRVIGDLAGLLTMIHGLPLAYNSDLQEDKEALFDAVDTSTASLECASALAGGVRYHPERMQAALAGAYVTATDLADYLVAKDVPFRSAHRVAGQVVQAAEERGVELWELSAEELRDVEPALSEDVFEILAPATSVRRRRHYGAPAPEQVEAQLEEAAAAIVSLRDWLAALEPAPIYRAHREGRLLEEVLP